MSLWKEKECIECKKAKMGSRKFGITEAYLYGPIEGVYVGKWWRKRAGVAAAGVHSPGVAGIHGCKVHGAYSIVVSGNVNNHDEGDRLVYAGCGRLFKDQTLDPRYNKSLAMSCNAPFNDENGATAKDKDWRGGMPVRVIRSHRGKSKYAPNFGYRYDGIYKVKSYYYEIIRGFKVWKFVLSRDDKDNPAPWTEAGRQHMIKMFPNPSKQHKRTLKKRQAIAKLDALGKIPIVKQPRVAPRKTAPRRKIPKDVPKKEVESTQKPPVFSSRNIDVQGLYGLSSQDDVADIFKDSEEIVCYENDTIQYIKPDRSIDYFDP